MIQTDLASDAVISYNEMCQTLGGVLTAGVNRPWLYSNGRYYMVQNAEGVMHQYALATMVCPRFIMLYLFFIAPSSHFIASTCLINNIMHCLIDGGNCM